MKFRQIIIRVPSVSNTKFEQNVAYKCIKAPSNPVWVGSIAWKDGDVTHVVREGRKRHAHGNFFDANYIFRKASTVNQVEFTEMNNDGAWKSGTKNFNGEDGHKKPKAKPVAPIQRKPKTVEELQAIINKQKADIYSTKVKKEIQFVQPPQVPKPMTGEILIDEFGDPHSF